jgi:hypothetical protein
VTVVKLNLLLLSALVAATVPLLAGCEATVPTIKVPETVRVEIPVPCIAASQWPQQPRLRTADELMAMDEYSRTLASWSELEKLWGYAPALEALVDGCSRLPP